MAILQNSGLCDEVVNYPFGTRSVEALAKVRQAIREINPDVLIHLAAGRGRLKSLRDLLFFRSCGVKNIVGIPWRRRDLCVQQTAAGEFEPESQRLVSRLASLGSIDLADQAVWNLQITPAERSEALTLLPSQEKNFLAVSVGTKVPAKDWGEENWSKLLALLSNEMPNVKLVLVGSPDEQERSEKLGWQWKGGHINLCGQGSPRVSAAVFERCRLFIGHDSGPMHLAAVAGIPTLGLFAWHNPPGQWFPGHRSWKFIKALYPPLPLGGWNLSLQLKEGEKDGIRLLQPNDVFQSAMSLWRTA
jgi:heptosyltransferase III